MHESGRMPDEGVRRFAVTLRRGKTRLVRARPFVARWAAQDGDILMWRIMGAGRHLRQAIPG